MRLHRKNGPTVLALAQEMVETLRRWFPDRTFRLCADGCQAPLAGMGLPRTLILSRMRRAAAIYKLAPKNRRGKRGPKPKKGARLPIPAQLVTGIRDWKKAAVDFRGKIEKRRIATRVGLGYGPRGQEPVRPVFCRDPKGRQESGRI